MTPHDPVHTAINEAASRITNARPSSELRANVMSRIAVQPAARLRAWRFGVAFGALATVALVAFVSWPSRPEISQTPIFSPTLVNPTVINSRVDPTTSTPPPSPVTSVNAARIERVASFTPSEADLEWSANAPPALERPDPLKRVESLEMKPLDNITPLSVAPLVVPALGDDGSNR